MIADIETAIESFRNSFNPTDGHLHGSESGELSCRKCQKTLSGPDGPRPAETYAGTYNGLCYDCTGSSRFIVAEYHDGAIRWSYPPHCPSWRRDREEFTAYPDCDDCNGNGRTMVSRPMSSGGSYPSYCGSCLSRYQKVQNEIKARALRGIAARVEKADVSGIKYGPAYMAHIVSQAIIEEIGSGDHDGPEGENRGVSLNMMAIMVENVMWAHLATKNLKIRWRSAKRCQVAIVEALLAKAESL